MGDNPRNHAQGREKWNREGRSLKRRASSSKQKLVGNESLSAVENSRGWWFRVMPLKESGSQGVYSPNPCPSLTC